MTYNFRKVLVPSEKYNIKCPYAMRAKYITIHNTANSASAKNEISYMINNSNKVSYHVAVDDVEVIQAIEFNRNAFHAGDGAYGVGNRNSIAIEICYSTGDLEKFKKAEINCAKYVASLLKEFGWGIERVKKHQDWSGKNCPHKTLEYGWDRFLQLIQSYLDVTEDEPQQSEYKTGNYNAYVVTTDDLNVREKRNPTSTVKGTIPKGTKIKVEYILYQDNSTTLKGSLWGGVYTSYGNGFINMDYVKPVVDPYANTSFKVKIITDSLNVRKEPDFNSEVVATVSKGGVYTILEEVNGLGKLKSGVGYISLNEKYVQKL